MTVLRVVGGQVPPRTRTFSHAPALTSAVTVLDRVGKSI